MGKASRILAIDPGPIRSGWVVFDGGSVAQHGVDDNNEFRASVGALIDLFGVDVVAIEMIASYGMAVGKDVFETCLWIGRFIELVGGKASVKLVYRKDVKMHLCGTPKAKDANIRQAIIDLFPATGNGKTPQIGTKAKPGPLYGISSHVWPALGVALTVASNE